VAQRHGEARDAASDGEEGEGKEEQGHQSYIRGGTSPAMDSAMREVQE
jgi:hypothetical protein